jgi:hypothetical protein
MTRGGAERSLEIGLFAEDACMRLGMFGTVVGCLIMFGADIASFDAGDASKTAALIQNLRHSHRHHGGRHRREPLHQAAERDPATRNRW